MVSRTEKTKRLNSLFGFIGKGMEVYAKDQLKRGRPGPSLEYVRALMQKTQEGGLPLILEGEAYLNKNGRFVTQGQFERKIFGNVEISEAIKIPHDLFNADGSFNVHKVAILVHELGHALQNESMRNIPEKERAKIPVHLLEEANQALSIGVWNHLAQIQNAEKGTLHWAAKSELGEHLEMLPEIKTDVMKFHDRVSRFPGAKFLKKVDPELYESFYRGKGINVRMRRGADPIKELKRQLKAARGNVDVDTEVTVSMMGHNIPENLDSYVHERENSAKEILKKFRPVLLMKKQERELANIYKKDFEIMASLTNLEGMKKRESLGRLSTKELETLHSYAIKNKFSNLWNGKDARKMIDFVSAYKIGELEANRSMLENPRAIEQSLGRYLKKQHDMNFYPEDYMDSLAGKDPKKRKILEEIRAKSHEKFDGKKEFGKTGGFFKKYKERRRKII